MSSKPKMANGEVSFSALCNSSFQSRLSLKVLSSLLSSNLIKLLFSSPNKVGTEFKKMLSASSEVHL